MTELQIQKDLCPRLLDYVAIVGSRHPNRNNSFAQSPELLRRYPLEDHADFSLPPDVVFFCQPEGCTTVGQKRTSLRENNSFVFTLTEKDTGRKRYGVCINFFRQFEKKTSSDHRKEKAADKRSEVRPETASSSALQMPSSEDSVERKKRSSPRARRRQKTAKKFRNNTLTSLCILSHHPFFTIFRECLFILKRIIDVCNDRTCRKVGSAKYNIRESLWGVLTGAVGLEVPAIVRHDIREIETWVLRLLSAPVPVPGRTRLELAVLPPELQPPLTLALPEHTRFALADFPIHLPLELLGIDTCLKVLTCIILEHKVVFQSRDYNALSMSVMAFVAMVYPLEYMFPVIPLLPTCMTSAEQLLLAPTPYIIGVPASFFPYKSNFNIPDDVCIVDLDANKVTIPRGLNLPSMPEPETSVLKSHLKQALASMSMSPHPEVNNLDTVDESGATRLDSLAEGEVSPFIFGNDVDSVDVATRVALVKYFNSPNILANHTEHARTLRLHPRPVVAFEIDSFLQSRPSRTSFIKKLARTQAVEYFGEWALAPTNVTYLRIQTGVYDPAIIGDKAKWYSHQLNPIDFKVYQEGSSLGGAMLAAKEPGSEDSEPTDESGSDSEEGDSTTSSSYSSLSDFVVDMMNSDLVGNIREGSEIGALQSGIDHSVIYTPPNTLQLPDESTNSDSPFSPDSESSSSSDPLDSQDQDLENTEGGNSLSQPRYNLEGEGASTSRNQSAQIVDHENNTLPPGKSSAANSPRANGSAPSHGLFSKINAMLRSDSEDSAPPSPVRKPTFLQGLLNLSQEEALPASPPGSEVNGYAGSVASDPGHLYESGGSRSSSGVSSNLSINHKQRPARRKKNTSPFPTGNRKMLTERSSLIRHSPTAKKAVEREKAPSPTTPTEIMSSSENQQFIKEIVHEVLEGNGVGWLKYPKLKRLMQNENLRAQAISQLYPQDTAITGSHIEDVKLTKPVYKGMLTFVKAIVTGLEYSFENQTTGGMASLFALLEIAHTHYYGKDINESSSRAHTPDGLDQDSLGWQENHKTDDELEKGEDNDHSSKLEDNRNSSSFVMVNETDVSMVGSGTGEGVMGALDKEQGAGFGDRVNLAPGSASKKQPPRQRRRPGTEEEDHGIEIVVDRVEDEGPPHAVTRPTRLEKINSMDSEMSEGSTLVSTSSETLGNDSDFSINSGEYRVRSARFNRHGVKSSLAGLSISDSEIELNGGVLMPQTRRKRPPVNTINAKSHLSSGFRYRDNILVAAEVAVPDMTYRHYIFEGLIVKERSPLWDKMQFWEDSFYDAVAAERDAVGMDQGPAEMIQRYKSLEDIDRRRLEEDEDRLLSVMLYNMVAFMLITGINKNDIKKKSRRLLGKSHIGLSYSQDINDLLDNINKLNANDIDLKPCGSRQMRKHSFVVHAGANTRGDVLFMEVCDDAVIVRSGSGAVCDRIWYEKLVNMTYCPKTKVLCLCRRTPADTRLDKFYTKKCRELYHCIKESMEKAALRKNGLSGGPDLGGEFPIQDVSTGEGGLLQVTLEGIGLKFASSKEFIELKDIKKCHVTKDVFVVLQYDSESKKITKRRFRSGLANEICYAMVCVFSYVAAAKSGDSRKDLEARMAQRKQAYLNN